MVSWQEIVRKANEAQANSQTNEVEAGRTEFARDQAKAQELFAKLQVERDEVFKKFSVREALDAIRRDVWKEGEIIEVKSKKEKELIDSIRYRWYEWSTKDPLKLRQLELETKFDWGGA